MFSCYYDADSNPFGKLFISDDAKTLIFQSKEETFQLEINLQDIIEIEKRGSIFSPGIRISTLIGRYQFSKVSKRDTLFDLLSKATEGARSLNHIPEETTNTLEKLDLEVLAAHDDINLQAESISNYAELDVATPSVIRVSPLASVIDQDLNVISVNNENGGNEDLNLKMERGASTSSVRRQNESPFLGWFNSLLGKSSSGAMDTVKSDNSPMIQALSDTFALTTRKSSPERGIPSSLSSIRSSYFMEGAISDPTARNSCPCISHYRHIVMEKTYPVPIEILFDALFRSSTEHNSVYLKTHSRLENTIEYLDEWRAAKDNILYERINRLLVSFKAPMVPKSKTPCIERQIIILDETRCKITESIIEMPNVPYGETFLTLCRYCMTSGNNGANSTKLLVTREVRFRDKCFWEGRIERNAIESGIDWFEELDLVIFEYLEENPRVRALSNISSGQEITDNYYDNVGRKELDDPPIENFFGDSSVHYQDPDDHPLFADTIDEDNPWYLPTEINIWLLLHVIVKPKMRRLFSLWKGLEFTTKTSFLILVCSLAVWISVNNIFGEGHSPHTNPNSENVAKLKSRLEALYVNILEDYEEAMSEFVQLEIMFNRNARQSCHPPPPLNKYI